MINYDKLSISATVISLLLLILLISWISPWNSINEKVKWLNNSYLILIIDTLHPLITSLLLNLNTFLLLLGNFVSPKSVLVEPCKAVDNNRNWKCESEDADKSTESTKDLSQECLPKIILFRIVTLRPNVSGIHEKLEDTHRLAWQVKYMKNKNL